MSLPKAIQKEAWSERTYRSRAGCLVPRSPGQPSLPLPPGAPHGASALLAPGAEVRNALGTRGSARGGELPH
jgi:hypothetical protein